MTTQPTPLPPTVAELHNDIMHEFAWLSENWQGKLRKWLDKLCRRAADPAPVADEAAIKAWESESHPWTGSDYREWVRRGAAMMRAAPRNDDGRLRKLREEMQAEWLECIENKKQFPVGSGDRRECQAEANAFQSACFRIDRLLAESPAGDAGESVRREHSFDPHAVARKLQIIASGLTYNEGKAEGVAKHWIYEVAWRIQAGLDHVPDEKRMRGQIDDLRETVSAQQQTIDKLLAESPAGDAVGLFGDDKLRSEIAAKWGHAGAHVEVFDDLRARLQAAEADLAAAKSIYREHWDDCDTVAEMMRSACNEAVTRLAQFKDRGGIIDKLEADLAAAQQQAMEASQIAMTANTEAVRYKKERDAKLSLLAAQQTIEEMWSILGHRDKALPQFAARQVVNDLAAAKAEGARAVVEELAKLACVFETQSYVPYANPASKIWSRIGELRAAQPQTTTAAPATVRQGDEVLREVVTMPFADLIAEEDAKRYYRMVTLCLKELARRALEGKP